jgi:hypothetical protein
MMLVFTLISPLCGYQHITGRQKLPDARTRSQNGPPLTQAKPAGQSALVVQLGVCATPAFRHRLPLSVVAKQKHSVLEPQGIPPAAVQVSPEHVVTAVQMPPRHASPALQQVPLQQVLAQQVVPHRVVPLGHWQPAVALAQTLGLGQTSPQPRQFCAVPSGVQAPLQQPVP